MRPIDLLSSCYYSLKPRGRTPGSGRWRARPVAAAAVLLLLSLAVLLPAMALAQDAVPDALEGVAVVNGDSRLRLNWTPTEDTTITKYQYKAAVSLTTAKWVDVPLTSVWSYSDKGTIKNAFLISMTTGTTDPDPTKAEPVKPLTNTQPYALSIRAVNDAGNGLVATATGTPSATSPLAQVQDVTVTPGDESVNLAWSAVTTYAGVGYQYCSEDCDKLAGWKSIEGSDLRTTTHTVLNLTNGDEYTFKMRGMSNASSSKVSSKDSATVPAKIKAGVPTAPTDLKATIGDTRVRLDWTASDGNGSPILMYKYSLNNDALVTVDGGASATYVLIEKNEKNEELQNGQSYQLTLIAVNSLGNSTDAVLDKVKPSAKPGAPTDLKAIRGNEQATLKWTAPDYLDVTGYEYKQDSAAWKAITGSSKETTCHIVIGLTNNIEATFTVHAVNAPAGGARVDGADSTPVTVKPGTLVAPTDLTATVNGEAVTLSWTDPAACTGTPSGATFEYRYTSVEGDWSGDWVAVPIVAGKLTEITLSTAGDDSPLTPGVTYHFQVRAKTTTLSSPMSNTANATAPVVSRITTAATTLDGAKGTVTAPSDAGTVTAAISRAASDPCGSRIGSRSIRLCVDVNTTGSLSSGSMASIEVKLDSAAWTALRPDSSSTTLHKRSDADSSWAAVDKCADSTGECYSATANTDDTGGVIEVKNISSFGHFALARRVAAPNTPPRKVGAIPEQIVTIGSNEVLDVNDYFRDADNDRLRYMPTSSDSTVVTASISGSTVVFNMVRPGQTTMTVIAIDPTGGTAFQSFAITVQPANVAPEAEGSIEDQVVGAEPLTIDIGPYFTDADGDNLTYTAESDNEAAVSVSMSGSRLTLTWVAAGESTVTITAKDRFDETAMQEASVRANTPPEAVGSIPTQAMRAGGASQEVDADEYFTDADGDELAYTAESDSPSIAAAVLLDGQSIVITRPLTPGEAMLTITATDPYGHFATQSVTAVVAAVPPPPTPTPAPTPTPEPTATPVPPTATPEPTATPAPTATPLPVDEGGGFPIWLVAILILVIAAVAGGVFLMQQRRNA